MERESWQVEVARLNVFKWVHCRPVKEHSQQRNFDICISKVFDSTDTEPLHTDHPYQPLGLIQSDGGAWPYFWSGPE